MHKIYYIFNQLKYKNFSTEGVYKYNNYFIKEGRQLYKGYNTPVLKVIFSENSVKLAEENKFFTHFFSKTFKNLQKSAKTEHFRRFPTKRSASDIEN